MRKQLLLRMKKKTLYSRVFFSDEYREKELLLSMQKHRTLFSRLLLQKNIEEKEQFFVSEEKKKKQ